jgi:uncharacterized protein YjeT (DUF2065 family)
MSTIRAEWLSKVVLVLGALSLLVPGVWAFVAPRNFASIAAPWASLGEHFLRDAGAFQMAIGVVVLAVLFWSDAIAIALAGVSVASLLHGISPGIDADYAVAVSLVLLGVLAVVAFLLRVRRPGSERSA